MTYEYFSYKNYLFVACHGVAGSNRARGQTRDLSYCLFTNACALRQQFLKKGFDFFITPVK